MQGSLTAGLRALIALSAVFVAAAGADPRSEEIPDFARRALVPSTHTPAPAAAIPSPAAAVRLGSRAPRLAGVTDWGAVIDSTWGPGLPTVAKLVIFESVWNTIDDFFACFHDLDVDWDAMHSNYVSEISQGVSRGRFAAIMNHLTLALRESHTKVLDLPVNGSAPDPGVPLLFVGGWGWNTHFGAGLTPLPDRSLLIYKAVSPHPLGLEPGDIVLGYDGRRWEDLYPELISAQLPLAGWWWGCSPSSYEHSWLMSAGMNWHLFDTIDVVKHSTGETVHLPTAPLQQTTTPIFCSEQLPVPGVTMPDFNAQTLFTYGIIEGTTIGYIYGWGWFWNAELEFASAVMALRNSTTGLIIDFRMNYGGNMFLSNYGLSQLFGANTPTIGFSQRCRDIDRLAMCPSPTGPPSSYIIPGSPAGFYDHPIAVLTGPGAVSSGDQVALRMKFHPRVRVFGKSTATAFNAPTAVDLGFGADWLFRYARHDAYLVSDPAHHLTHREFQVDEEVWLQPDDVAQGRDTVVEAAIDWIHLQVPVLVQDLQAEATADAVRLSWVLAGEEELRELHVYRQEIAAGDVVRLASLGREAREYIDSTARPSAQYEYMLGVVGPDGIELRSGPVTVRTPELVLGLHPNLPNPFDISTTIRYDLPAAGSVVLRIHDVRGRTIRTLVHAHQGPGRHSSLWDGNDESGRTVASGIYIVRLEAGGSHRLGKMLRLRR